MTDFFIYLMAGIGTFHTIEMIIKISIYLSKRRKAKNMGASQVTPKECNM